MSVSIVENQIEYICVLDEEEGQALNEEEFVQEECAICLLPNEENVTVKTPCRHVFHYSCLLEWMKIRNTCPFCRHNLTEQELLVIID